MDDATKDELMKRTSEWLQSCVNAATRSGVPEEADLEAFILAHLDGEPARLAAAREEQREACADEHARDLLKMADERNAWMDRAEKAENERDALTRVGATPLTATPMADRIEELEREVSRRDALLKADGYEDMRQHAQQLASRIAELEKALADAVAIAREFDARGQEAVAALRELVGASSMLLGRFQRLHDSDVLREVNEQPTDNALERARAVLAKYPEGKR